jgi:chromosome partitioning protein
LFEAVIPETNELAAAAAAVHRGTLRQRWGYQHGYQALSALAGELMEKVGGGR